MLCPVWWFKTLPLYRSSNKSSLSYKQRWLKFIVENQNHQVDTTWRNEFFSDVTDPSLSTDVEVKPKWVTQDDAGLGLPPGNGCNWRARRAEVNSGLGDDWRERLGFKPWSCEWNSGRSRLWKLWCCSGTFSSCRDTNSGTLKHKKQTFSEYELVSSWILTSSQWHRVSTGRTKNLMYESKATRKE